MLIGRSLMAKYRILILDEPCAGLDPVARERFLQFLNRLAATEKTPNLVFVTHHVEEILPCFDKALVLRDGEILSQGAIGKVITSTTMSQRLAQRLLCEGSTGDFGCSSRRVETACRFGRSRGALACLRRKPGARPPIPGTKTATLEPTLSGRAASSQVDHGR